MKSFIFSRQVSEPPHHKLRNVSTEVKYVELELSPHWVVPPQHHLTWAQQHAGYPAATQGGNQQHHYNNYPQGQYGLNHELQSQQQGYGLSAEGIRDNGAQQGWCAAPLKRRFPRQTHAQFSCWVLEGEAAPLPGQRHRGIASAECLDGLFAARSPRVRPTLQEQ